MNLIVSPIALILGTALLCLMLISIPVTDKPSAEPLSDAFTCARLVEDGIWEGDEYHYAPGMNSNTCNQHKLLTAAEMKQVFEHFNTILVMGCSLSRRLGHNIDQILNLNLTEDDSGVFPVSELKMDKLNHDPIRYPRGLTSVFAATFGKMTRYLKNLGPLPQPAVVILSNGIHELHPDPDELDALSLQPEGLSGAPEVLRNLHNVIAEVFDHTDSLVVYRTEPWPAVSNKPVTPDMRASSDFGQLSAAVHAEFENARDVAFLDHAKIMFNRTLDSSTRLAEGKYHLKPPARYVLLHTLASFLQTLITK